MSNRRSTTATQRLKQDYIRIMKDPVPYVTAQPLQSNILEWHYVVQGPESTPYEGGIYHGKLVFPSEFPYKPPSIYMITPNGRFKCNTRLCLSISDFHPDTWNPAWSVSTILTGLLSFMVEKNPTLGSIETTDFEKRQLAASSGEFNLSNKVFCDLFPNVQEQIKQIIEKQRQELESRNLLDSSTGNKISSIGHNSIQRGFQHNGPGFMGSTLINIVVIVGFAAFAYTVKYVLKNVGEADL